MKDTLGKEFYESADKAITIKRQQTAVEFAIKKLEKFIPSGNQLVIHIILEQAKEMEEDQHKNTWFYSTSQFDNSAEMKEYTKKTFEQYYNETFKNK